MAFNWKYRITAEDKSQGAVNSAKKNAKSLEEGVGKVGGAIKGAFTVAAIMATAVAVGKATQAVYEFSRQAAELSQIQSAFESMTMQAGSMASDVIANMQRMSAGTVSELELMSAANKAMLFDIDIDKLDELMGVARASATALGGSVQQMFSDLVTGIGRASPMILDNLGLQLKVGEATAAYAAELGKTVAELTAVENKQAILNATLEAGEALMLKVGDAATELTDLEKFQQLETTWVNIKAEFGEKALRQMGPMRDWFQGLATDILDAVREANNLKQAIDDITQAEEGRTNLNSDWEENIRQMWDEVAAQREAVARTQAMITNQERNNVAGGRGSVDLQAQLRNDLEQLQILRDNLATARQGLRDQQGFQAAMASRDEEQIRLAEEAQRRADNESLIASLQAKAWDSIVEGIARNAQRELLLGNEFDEQAKNQALIYKAIDMLIQNKFTVKGGGIQAILTAFAPYLEDEPTIEAIKDVSDVITKQKEAIVETLKKEFKKVYDPKGGRPKLKSDKTGFGAPFTPGGEAAYPELIGSTQELLDEMKRLIDLNAYSGYTTADILPDDINTLFEDLGGIGMIADGIGGFAGELINATAAMGPYGIALALIQEALDGVFQVISGPINQVLGVFQGVLQRIGNLYGQAMLPVLNALYPAFQLISHILMTVFSPILNAVAGIFGVMGSLIQTLLMPIWKALATVIEVVMSPLKWLGDAFKWLGDWVVYISKKLSDWVYNLVHPRNQRNTAGAKPGAFSSDAFTGLDERIAAIWDYSPTNFEFDPEYDGGGGSAVYNTPRDITVNIEVNTDVITGEGGFDELALMLQNRLLEIGAVGLGA
ncbi:MAG: hypothetical protein ACTSWQ_00965 [Candidatus Thorarchaeota archaeon]